MEIIKSGFRNEKLGIELDVYLVEGKEWFKAKDISDLLSFTSASQMTRTLDEPDFDKAVQRLHTPGGWQYVSTISEAGLYEIILSITKKDRNRYDFAKTFKRWVFSEVLPSIRKSNIYANQDITSQQLESYMSENDAFKNI